MSHTARTIGTASHLHARRVAPPRGRGLHSIAPAQLHAQRLEPKRTTAPTEDYQKYDGAELRAFTRPGARDHEKYPSRMGQNLHYRDGRVVSGQR